MTSLAEQLSELLDPSVKSVDPEDDIYEETKAKVVDKEDLSGDIAEDDHEQQSQIVGRRMESLEGMGSFYRGQVVSRNQIASDSEDSGHGDVDVCLQEQSGEEEDNEHQGDEQHGEDMEGEEEGEEASDAEDLADMDGMDEEIDSDEAEGEGSLKIFKSPSGADPQAKGKATRNQLSLWESMLEARIKCQKILSISNRLPQHNTMEAFRHQVETSISSTDQVLSTLLNQLLELETKLLEQNSQTRSLAGSEMCKKRKSSTPLEEIDQVINDRFVAMRNHRNKVLKLWYDKTRLTSSTANTKSKSFTSFERSTVTQIGDILQDRERLIKRTQLKRSDYRILGTKVAENVPKLEESVENHSSHLKEFDEEIFDDDDFYHQLLRQLIEQKATGPGGSSDPLELTRQWLRIQRLRTKARKNVDTKASKGRKIRYEIHQKLQSFMAPNDASIFTHEARNQLFKSLFGNVPDCEPALER